LFRLSASRDDKRKELGLPADGFVLLNVGSMSTAQKGQEYLIEAIARLKNENNIWLIFAGDGRRRQKLTDEAKRLGVSGRILFLGKRKMWPN
jgi:glycosyltransferase involved in cell wall biosynthesis